jgi:hypothetical protein
MGDRELPQQRLAPVREADEDFPPVLGIVLAPREAPLGETVDQLDGAVMLNLQALGQLADGRPVSFGQAFDSQQKLVLLRLDPVRLGGVAAELQEAPDAISELGQRAILGGGEVGGIHKHIVSRYIEAGISRHHLLEFSS